MEALGMLVVTALTTMSMTVVAFAGEWKQDSQGSWWVNDDGSYPINTWQWIDEENDGIAECYYFDETGYLWTNDKLTPDGYQVDKEGMWIENGVLQTKQVITTNTKTIDTSHILGKYYIYNLWTNQYQDWAVLHCEKNSDGTYHIYSVLKDDNTIGLDFVCYAGQVEEAMAGTAFYSVETDMEVFRYIDHMQEFAYWGPWEVEYYGKNLS